MTTRVLLVLLALLSFVHAQNSADPVLLRLADVDRFAFGGVGFAGVMSRGEKGYRNVLARPSAEADFENLLSIGNPQAQLYALAGIHILNGKKFRRLSESFRDSKIDVTVQDGCIVHHEPFTVILKRIDAGDFILYGSH